MTHLILCEICGGYIDRLIDWYDMGVQDVIGQYAECDCLPCDECARYEKEEGIE